MKILIVIDKFKQTYTSSEISELISRSISEIDKNTDIRTKIVSDGGDGFLESIENEIHVNRTYLSSSDPLFRKIETYYLFSDKTKTAFIEMAKTSGLRLLEQNEQNPMNTSTFGLGETILHAVKNRAEQIFIGLGGSATTDAGIGMANALGYQFIDNQGNILHPTGRNLCNIFKIDDSIIKNNFTKLEIIGLYDVDNFLYGKKGAAYTYSKQKGANIQEIRCLNSGLKNITEVFEEQYDKKLSHIKGAGAAGGLGFGIAAFLDGKLGSGSEFIFNFLGLEDEIDKADIIITGEGKLDQQTLNRKIVQIICESAKKKNKRLYIITGFNQLTEQQSRTLGISNIYQLFDKEHNIEFLKEKTPERIKTIVARLLKHINS